jgi:serine/threonine protein kinase
MLVFAFFIVTSYFFKKGGIPYFYLIDFGGSILMKKGEINKAVTYDNDYSPKEQLYENIIFPESDVFSLGKVFEIVLNKTELEIDPDLKEILKNMLNENYLERFSIEKVISEINLYCLENKIDLKDEFSDEEMQSPLICENISFIREMIEKEKSENLSINEKLTEKDQKIEKQKKENEEKDQKIEQQKKENEQQKKENEEKDQKIEEQKIEIERLKEIEKKHELELQKLKEELQKFKK